MVTFKHIKRPEEIGKWTPQPALPPGYVRISIDNWVKYSLPEKEYNHRVFEEARDLGYQGSEYEFFCRDAKGMPDDSSDRYTYTWRQLDVRKHGV